MKVCKHNYDIASACILPYQLHAVLLLPYPLLFISQSHPWPHTFADCNSIVLPHDSDAQYLTQWYCSLRIIMLLQNILTFHAFEQLLQCAGTIGAIIWPFIIIVLIYLKVLLVLMPFSSRRHLLLSYIPAFVTGHGAVILVFSGFVLSSLLLEHMNYEDVSKWPCSKFAIDDEAMIQFM